MSAARSHTPAVSGNTFTSEAAKKASKMASNAVAVEASGFLCFPTTLGDFPPALLRRGRGWRHGGSKSNFNPSRRQSRSRIQLQGAIRFKRAVHVDFSRGHERVPPSGHLVCIIHQETP